MIVQIQNENGVSRNIKVGFSWTAFFFGPFPFLFRGMPMSYFAWVIGGIYSGGIMFIVLWFSINKLTALHYMDKGYKPIGEGWDYASAQWNIKKIT